ncbi:unnamed protein product [Closterium sp. Naga37s-1]|nr:unnamed protein product [Closterium sp. Naga37s-1]
MSVRTLLLAALLSLALLATAADPLATAADPLATAADPLATAADPLATPADSLATPADPLATAADPLATAAAAAKTAGIIGELKALRQKLESCPPFYTFHSTIDWHETHISSSLAFFSNPLHSSLAEALPAAIYSIPLIHITIFEAPFKVMFA